MEILICLVAILVIVACCMRAVNVYIKPAIKEANESKKKKKLFTSPPRVQKVTDEIIRTRAKTQCNLTTADMDRIGINLVLSGADDNGERTMYFFKVDNQVYAYCHWQLLSGKPSFGVASAKTSTLKYHPSDIRYTSVTIGGVTTGGFSEHGNYYTEEYHNTGKGDLWCKMDGYSMIVLSMKVNSALEEEVKKDKFLSGLRRDRNNNIVLLHDTGNAYKDEFQRAFQKDDLAACTRAQSENLKLAYFTKRECQNVADWITTTAFSDIAYK